MKSLATTAGKKEISPQIFCIRYKNIAVSTAGLLGERPKGHHGGMGWDGDVVQHGDVGDLHRCVRSQCPWPERRVAVPVRHSTFPR